MSRLPGGPFCTHYGCRVQHNSMTTEVRCLLWPEGVDRPVHPADLKGLKEAYQEGHDLAREAAALPMVQLGIKADTIVDVIAHRGGLISAKRYWGKHIPGEIPSNTTLESILK